MLCSVDGQLVIDVSGQSVGAVCKGQAVQNRLVDTRFRENMSVSFQC